MSMQESNRLSRSTTGTVVGSHSDTIYHRSGRYEFDTDTATIMYTVRNERFILTAAVRKTYGSEVKVVYNPNDANDAKLKETVVASLLVRTSLTTLLLLAILMFERRVIASGRISKFPSTVQPLEPDIEAYATEEGMEATI